MNKKKKKQRKSHRDSTPPLPLPLPLPHGGGEEAAIIGALVEFFGSSVSIEEASAAYKEAHGNPNRATEVLAAGLSSEADEPSACSVSSLSASDSGYGKSSLSGSSDWYAEGDFVGEKKGPRDCFKARKIVAATGTVSSVIGKDYLKAGLRKDVTSQPKGFRKMHERENEEEEKVQFLCTMLGEEGELSFAVVRDVLCQCAYNAEKALDVLLDLSASSHEQSEIVFNNPADNEDNARISERIENINDAASDCTSHSGDCELPENIWSIGRHDRNSSEASTAPDIPFLPPVDGMEINISQELLGIFYKVPKSPQHVPKMMNWQKIAKKFSAFGNGCDVPDCPAEPPVIPADGGEYSLLRTEAQQHWNSMKSSYQKAAAAYSRGEKSYAAYLSDEGRKYSVMGQAADEKASLDIFKFRNRNIENIITIDLHGQHVKQAMRLLKIHLLLPSIKKLRVITGCGAHGLGKSKLKQSVLRLAEKSGIKWIEENRGTIMLKVDGHMDYNFVDSDSDTG